jgi:hypothetical protein
LAAEIAGNCIQILQSAVFIPVGPASKEPKEDFLRQVFRRMPVVKMKEQIFIDPVILIFQIHCAPSFPKSSHYCITKNQPVCAPGSKMLQ